MKYELTLGGHDTDDPTDFYISLNAWCFDMGYMQRLSMAIWHNETDYISILDRYTVRVLSNNKKMIKNISEVWKEDTRLWVIHPKFKYYNNKIVPPYNRGSSITEFMFKLGEIFGTDNYHIYYSGYYRMISFRTAEDEVLYKLMFY